VHHVTLQLDYKILVAIKPADAATLPHDGIFDVVQQGGERHVAVLAVFCTPLASMAVESVPDFGLEMVEGDQLESVAYKEWPYSPQYCPWSPTVGRQSSRRVC
jgi:hypothetical protein